LAKKKETKRWENRKGRWGGAQTPEGKIWLLLGWKERIFGGRAGEGDSKTAMAERKVLNENKRTKKKVPKEKRRKRTQADKTEGKIKRKGKEGDPKNEKGKNGKRQKKKKIKNEKKKRKERGHFVKKKKIIIAKGRFPPLGN